MKEILTSYRFKSALLVCCNFVMVTFRGDDSKLSSLSDASKSGFCSSFIVESKFELDSTSGSLTFFFKEVGSVVVVSSIDNILMAANHFLRDFIITTSLCSNTTSMAGQTTGPVKNNMNIIRIVCWQY